MVDNVADHEFTRALEAIEAENISVEDKIELLIQIADGLQKKPKSVQQLQNAVKLYDRALAICSPAESLLASRIHARKGTAFQAIPGSTMEYLLKAKCEFELALTELALSGLPEEIAEVEMNLGLVTQTLSGLNAASISDAIAAYQRALRVFKREKYPKEYAILHNNLATAYLSIPVTDEKSKMREALAVQSFEEALKVVTLIDQPGEYAMLQNNLGNALQYASSGHVVENSLRAIEAYDEALKVRTKHDTPPEYANTICNKANCLRNLPDDLQNPEHGNIENLYLAQRMYNEALAIFEQYGETTKISLIEEILQEMNQELKQNPNPLVKATALRDSTE